jgi:hypothetical protein
MKKRTPLCKAAPARRTATSICHECFATLAVREAREVDRFDRERASKHAPVHPWADDSFGWLIALTLRIDGIELCATPRLGGELAEVRSFCKYRRRRYGGSAERPHAL